MHRILATAAALTATLAATPARAGEVDLAVGLAAATSSWDGDHGGGATLDLSYWLARRFGVTFASRELYAAVDDRLLSYFSVGVATRRRAGRATLVGALGLVHQHEEPLPGVEYQPVQSLLGVGDGIRHRAGVRAGGQVVVPVRAHRHGDFFVALDVDATWFGDDRGPSWMVDAGASIGFTYGGRR